MYILVLTMLHLPFPWNVHNHFDSDVESCLVTFHANSSYYMCRARNILQTQEVNIHLTLDYQFFKNVKIYSILTGLGVAILFTIATLIGELLFFSILFTIE